MDRSHLRPVMALAAITVVIALLMGCAGGPSSPAGSGSDRTGWPNSVSFAGPSIGSTPHVVVTAFGTMVTKYMGLTWNYEPGIASSAGVAMLGEGKIDFMASASSDVYYFAPKGTGPMEGKKVTNVRLLFPTLLQGFLIFSRPQDNIKTVSDIKGKRLTWQSTAWNSATFAEDMLGSVGLTWNDVQKAPTTQQQSAVQLMTDRKTDVIVWIENTMVGAPNFMEMDRLVGAYVIGLTEAQQKYLMGKEPYLSAGTISPNLYKGQDKAVPAMILNQGFAARKEVPDSLVYELMKVAFDHNDEFRESHALMKVMTSDEALRRWSTAMPVPWHAGGVKYWKERGLWKSEYEARQKALLAEVGQDK